MSGAFPEEDDCLLKKESCIFWMLELCYIYWSWAGFGPGLFCLASFCRPSSRFRFRLFGDTVAGSLLSSPGMISLARLLALLDWSLIWWLNLQMSVAPSSGGSAFNFEEDAKSMLRAD